MDSEQTAPIGSGSTMFAIAWTQNRLLLIWVHTVCHRGFLNISADEKSRRLLLRLAHLGYIIHLLCIPATVCNFNLTLKAPIATKVVCFPRLLKCLRRLYDKQAGPRSDCSDLGPLCLLPYLNSSVMLDNYLQQTTSADVIFQMHFFLAL